MAVFTTEKRSTYFRRPILDAYLDNPKSRFFFIQIQLFPFSVRQITVALGVTFMTADGSLRNNKFYYLDI